MRYEGPSNDMYQTEHDELFSRHPRGKTINHGTWMTTARAGDHGPDGGLHRTGHHLGKAMNSQEELAPKT